MLKIEKVIEMWKCDPYRVTAVIDILTNPEAHELETDFFQDLLYINFTKNFLPFLVIQCLNFVKTLKFEKVIEIWKCDLCCCTPCIICENIVQSFSVEYHFASKKCPQYKKQ